eukprot:scaffold671717_cov46-Prasinocladus_malaysianus.AAC.1
MQRPKRGLKFSAYSFWRPSSWPISAGRDLRQLDCSHLFLRQEGKNGHRAVARNPLGTEADTRAKQGSHSHCRDSRQPISDGRLSSEFCDSHLKMT